MSLTSYWGQQFHWGNASDVFISKQTSFELIIIILLSDGVTLKTSVDSKGMQPKTLSTAPSF